MGSSLCQSGCLGLGLVKFGCGILCEARPYLFGNWSSWKGYAYLYWFLDLSRKFFIKSAYAALLRVAEVLDGLRWL